METWAKATDKTITLTTYESAMDLIEDEVSKWRQAGDVGCPDEVNKAAEQAATAFQNADELFHSCGAGCNDEATELRSDWASAKLQLKTVRSVIGDDLEKFPWPATSLDRAYVACLDVIKDGKSVDVLAPVYLELQDEGRTLSVSRPAEYYAKDDAQVAACILNQLDTPASVISLMDSTTALMGRQEESWGDVIARWSYHPDNGINMLLELDDGA